jgi:hypothetical protein
MIETQPKCLVCERSSQEVPLLALQYADQQYWICPQHLPVLIHNPETLTGRLPGVENLTGHAHD